MTRANLRLFTVLTPMLLAIAYFAMLLAPSRSVGTTRPAFDCFGTTEPDTQDCQNSDGSACNGCAPTGDPQFQPKYGHCDDQGYFYTNFIYTECQSEPNQNTGYCNTEHMTCWLEVSGCMRSVEMFGAKCTDMGDPPVGSNPSPGDGRCFDDPLYPSCRNCDPTGFGAQQNITSWSCRF